MPTDYKYELWNGKAVVGHYLSKWKMQGKHLIVNEVSILKQQYSKPIKEIKIPVAYRIVSNDGVDMVVRTVLDVRGKSKRQIEIIKKGSQ